MIAFIGLGEMGKGIAYNLLKSGEQMIVCNRSQKHFEEFSAKGCQTTTTVGDTAKAEVIFLCLPDGEIVEEVLFGAEGLRRKLCGGQIIVDCSTISYLKEKQFAQELEKGGVLYVDAPVSGMRRRAEEGTLTVMCGGDENTVNRLWPLFSCFATKIIYMGDSGNGQLAKLINQILFDINAAALAEILPLSAYLGLDSQKIGEIINSGTGKSYASEFFIPHNLKGDFSEGYPLEKAYKDLVSAAEIGMKERIPLPVLAAATAVYQETMRMGFAAENKGAMIKVSESLLGTEFRSWKGNSV